MTTKIVPVRFNSRHRADLKRLSKRVNLNQSELIRMLVGAALAALESDTQHQSAASDHHSLKGNPIEAEMEKRA